ncbi:MAG: prenyltransferase/squalene oxidase repeat-containing protein [Pirellulaceae bacterium]
MNSTCLGSLVAVGMVLTAMASADDPDSAASTTPRLPPVAMPAADAIQQSLDRGIAFLLEDQNPNGSWGTPQRTKNLNVYAPVPGAHHAFRTAVTSLCISALCEVGTDREDVRTSIDRAEQWLVEHLPHLRRANGTAIYNVWGHGYSIQALVRLHQRTQDPERRAQFVELIRSQFDLLDRYASVDGGWGYYDQRVQAKQPTTSSMSFVNATVLIAFHEARTLGVEPPEKLVRRAVAALKRQCKPDFSYLYGEYLKNRPMRAINRPRGSLGRSQACNLALRLWGDDRVTDDLLATWLHRLFARNGWLDMGRKRPIPHESWFQVAGYFFYYGHYYGGLCIAELPAEDRPEFQAHMAGLLLRLQEKDGSWWDFPLYNYHQQYGTAYALMTLRRCQPE